ncbi:uncharacterized protein BCR38DRAFT_404442 [Pseudomassariella vexata]|uniref:J domain-containing protein n=1 Tax=Pseudomassariella vexata TaxID=1141098 RepID=A0A1Y2EIS2_9PEZI|nr:uncharacterized protein BCR38DRAFT_404442 [Pseudomassariella vexata]ORY71347.1 hypothetical protein BCR38DRAFT_404442 [Pseudomassariella vexata]
MFTLPEDPYKILGVSKNALLPEIRSAYRKLVLKCHPDKVADPGLKAVKQDEFQKVQKAYEMLSDENERQKYDDMVMANNMERENARKRADYSYASRTPPRREDGYRDYKIRTANPPEFTRSSSFPASSPYTYNTPPSSTENHSSDSARDHRSSKKKDSDRERDHRSSRREEKERQKRAEAEQKKAQADWDRDQDRSRKAEEERLRKDKEHRKEDKKRTEKDRDRERRRDTEDKRARQKPYMEDVHEHPQPHVIDVEPPRSDKKPKSSRPKHENEAEPPVSAAEATEREKMTADRKTADNLEFAANYLARSKAPMLNKTYASQPTPFVHTVTPPAAAPTPPPVTGAMPPPPPPVGRDRRDNYGEEDPRRPSAKMSSRRGSIDPRTREKVSSHKKSSSSRLPTDEYFSPPKLKKSSTMPTQYGAPVSGSPPRISRTKTDQHYARPTQHMPGMMRSHTSYSEDAYERSRSRRAYHYTDDESEDDLHYRGHMRRTHSPEVDPVLKTFRYAVSDNKTIPVSHKNYYASEANTGRPLERRPAMHSQDSYTSQGSQIFGKVKTSKYGDVTYGDVPHAPYDKHYGRGDGVYSY